MFPPDVRALTDNGEEAPTANTLLNILVSTPCPLSFCSCALANIPHQFLMHCHMVVLFFSSGAVTNKYEGEKKWSNRKRVHLRRPFRMLYVAVAFGSISWWSKCFKRFLKGANYQILARGRFDGRCMALQVAMSLMLAIEPACEVTSNHVEMAYLSLYVLSGLERYF